jgi:hypothetical protein
MRCPQCNGANLAQRKEFGPDPYDFVQQKKEGGAPPPPQKQEAAAPAAAPVDTERITICPYCGKKLDFPEVPKFCPYCEKQILH